MIEYETLSGEEIALVIKGKPLQEKKQVKDVVVRSSVPSVAEKAAEKSDEKGPDKGPDKKSAPKTPSSLKPLKRLMKKS